MHRPSTLLLMLVLWAGAATPVPMPVEVRPGQASLDGELGWVPATQVVTGSPGETVGIELAFDNGGEEPVEAGLATRRVRLDADGALTPGGTAGRVTLATDRIVLQPQARGLVVTTAEVPAEPTLVAFVAEVAPATAPRAIVLLAPQDAAAEIAVTVEPATATVVVANRGGGDAIVDLSVGAGSWIGRAGVHRITGLVLPEGGTRRVAADLPSGFGRREVAVAAAARGGPEVRASAADWTDRTVPAVIALLLLAGATGLLWRQTRRRPA